MATNSACCKDATAEVVNAASQTFLILGIAHWCHDCSAARIARAPSERVRRLARRRARRVKAAVSKQRDVLGLLRQPQAAGDLPAQKILGDPEAGKFGWVDANIRRAETDASGSSYFVMPGSHICLFRQADDGSASGTCNTTGASCEHRCCSLRTTVMA